MPQVKIRSILEQDHSWVSCMMRELWSAEVVVVHGTIFIPAELPGIIAEENGEPLGLLTYHLERDACEIVTLNSLRESIGIGTMLVEGVKQIAVDKGCRRLWVNTTNDNLHALGFYQKRGFHLVSIRPNALESSRIIKPEIPLFGQDGIEIRDEIELELLL